MSFLLSFLLLIRSRFVVAQEDSLDAQVDALIARAQLEALSQYSKLFINEDRHISEEEFIKRFVTRRLNEETRRILITKGVEIEDEAASEQNRRIVACNAGNDTIPPRVLPVSSVETSRCQHLPQQRNEICGRFALDHLATIEETELLRSAIDKAMVGLYHQGSSTSMAIDSMTALRFDGTPSWKLILDLKNRARLATTSFLGTCRLFDAGGLLTRIDATPRDNPFQINASHVYWNTHADKANIPYYDFSALLYLSSKDLHFTGGDLEFFLSNSTHPTICPRVSLAPKAGRLVAFSSGLENLHRVAPVLSGTRYVLALWFTCDPALALSTRHRTTIDNI